MAINERIQAEFPVVTIESRDIEEGFKRPSFFVSIETPNTERSLSDSMREMTCRIRYFPSDRHIYKEEAYDVMDRLEEVFALNFPVGDRVITINASDAEIIDKVVHFSFDFTLYESLSEEEVGEVMEELEFNG